MAVVDHVHHEVAGVLEIVHGVFFPFSRRPEEKAMVGGSLHTPMKKLKGARLGTPSAAMVDTQAMGRGTTQPMSSLYDAVVPMA
jgi:hypothetical protein